MRSILTTFALIVPAAVSAQAAPDAPAPRRRSRMHLRYTRSRLSRLPHRYQRVGPAPAVCTAAPTPRAAPVSVEAPVAAVPAAGAVAMHATMHVAIAMPDVEDPQRRVRTAVQPLLLQTWYPQDPADATYRAGREALMRGDYRGAVRHFDEIQRRWPRSQYAPQSYYWEAFALSRGNASTDDLRRAREALNTLRSRYPDADGLRDADALMQTINAQLAERGDAQSSAAVRRTASQIATQQGCAGVDDDNDTRVVALNALLQMTGECAADSEAGAQRRDACPGAVRRAPVRKDSLQTADILVDLVREHLDRESGGRDLLASQVDGTRRRCSRSRTSRDPALQEKAIFALSQHHSSRSAELPGLCNAQRCQRGAACAGHLLARPVGWPTRTFLRDIYSRVNRMSWGEGDLLDRAAAAGRRTRTS